MKEEEEQENFFFRRITIGFFFDCGLTMLVTIGIVVILTTIRNKVIPHICILNGTFCGMNKIQANCKLKRYHCQK